MEDVREKVKTVVEETEFDRRTFVLGGGALAVLAACAVPAATMAYANGEGGTGGSSGSQGWYLADPDVADEVLGRLDAAEAKSEQLRSDMDHLLSLLTADGRLPQEVYVGTSATSFDTMPALLVDSSDHMLYAVTE